MKKIILILATILCFFGVTKAQQQQTIVGNVVNGFIPMGGSASNPYVIFSSPLKTITVATSGSNIFSGKKLLRYNSIITLGSNIAGTGRLTAGSCVFSNNGNLNIVADSGLTGYSTNILYRGKNVFKGALSVTSTSATSTSTLNLMQDSGVVAIGYKLRASKLPLNDSAGLSAGDFYISGNTIKVKR